MIGLFKVRDLLKGGLSSVMKASLILKFLDSKAIPEIFKPPLEVNGIPYFMANDISLREGQSSKIILINFNKKL